MRGALRLRRALATALRTHACARVCKQCTTQIFWDYICCQLLLQKQAATCEQVYFDPALVDIIDGAFYYWNELKAKTLKLLPKWIIGADSASVSEVF